MQFLFYFSISFVIICLVLYLILLVQKNESGNNMPSIEHNIEDTKTNIPKFIIPDTKPKKIKENDRNIQFSRSLNRIIDIPVEEEELEEISIQKAPIVNHGNSHAYYQDQLKNKQINDDSLQMMEELRKDKVNNLLRRAAEISDISKEDDIKKNLFD